MKAIELTKQLEELGIVEADKVEMIKKKAEEMGIDKDSSDADIEKLADACECDAEEVVKVLDSLDNGDGGEDDDDDEEDDD